MNEDNNTITEKNDRKASERKPTASEAVFEWVEMFVYALALVLLIISFIGRHSPVNGESMTNTLQHGDLLIIQTVGYTPRDGDIVIAQSKPLGYHEPIVKRVIATEGQTVDINFVTWTVTVDGVPLDEPYVRFIENQPMRQFYDGMEFPLTVGEGQVFVMGDNRNGSWDSRSTGIGLIDERNIVGHVVYRLFPFDSMGTVE